MVGRSVATPAPGTTHCSSLSGDNGQINFQEQSKKSEANCPMDMVIMTYLPNFGVKQRVLEALVWWSWKSLENHFEGFMQKDTFNKTHLPFFLQNPGVSYFLCPSCPSCNPFFFFLLLLLHSTDTWHVLEWRTQPKTRSYSSLRIRFCRHVWFAIRVVDLHIFISMISQEEVF